MAEPRIQYAKTSDGVSIAYWKLGSGPPIVITPYHAFSHVAWEWGNSVNRSIYQRFAQFRSVIRYDGRGAGLSQRGAMDYSVDAKLLDLSAVIEAASTEPVTLVGMGISGPVAVRFAAEHPDSLSHLVLYDTVAAVPPPDELPGLTALRAVYRALDDRESFARVTAAIMGADPEWFSRYVKAAITPDELATAGRTRYDCYEFLPRVTCPTLVIHELWPGEHSRTSQELAASVPNAELCILERTLDDEWNDFADFSPHVYRFLGLPLVEPPAADARSIFATVLFTDLVGHTEMMSRLGDERGRAVLREHERITRETLKAHGGAEVKTMGDGFMASFGSVTRAVECAIALQRAFADRDGEPLSVRVGLNAGEPIEEDGDLFGATVILASRIAAKAEGGEILVANAVREISSGKGFLFADRGDFVAKGFEEPVRVYEVRWRDD